MGNHLFPPMKFIDGSPVHTHLMVDLRLIKWETFGIIDVDESFAQRIGVIPISKCQVETILFRCLLYLGVAFMCTASWQS